MNNSSKTKPPVVPVIIPTPLGPGGLMPQPPLGPGGQSKLYVPCSACPQSTSCPHCKPKISDSLSTLSILILILSALILILPTLLMYMSKAYKKA